MKTLNDLSAPRDIHRKYLEKDLQKQCVDWARARGYWARKFSSISQRSVPDYLFSRGRTQRVGYMDYPVRFFTEFKRPGCKRDPETGLMSTKAQLDEQQAMRAAGWVGFECDNFEVFKSAVIAYENELQRAEVNWL